MEHLSPSIAGSMPSFTFWTAAVATLLLMGFCVICSAKSATKAGQIPWFAAFVLLLGSIPVWSTALYLFFESLGYHGLEFWGAAPWLIILMIFQHLGYTIGAAVAVVAAYVLVPGMHSRKLAAAAVLGLLAVGGFAWRVNANQEAEQQRRTREQVENKAVEAFVRTAPQVVNALPSAVPATVHSSRRNEAGQAIQYELFAYSQSDVTRSINVVVDVAHRNGEVEFRIRCVIPHPAQDAAIEQCKSPSASP